MKVGAAFAATALAALAALAACGHDVIEPRFALSLVAAGRVLGAGNAPAENALVTARALSAGEPGGEFGCTGSNLLWIASALTGPDGGFMIGMELQRDGKPVCVRLFAQAAGDTVWRDTASVVRVLKPVASGVAPDTVYFELRVSR